MGVSVPNGGIGRVMESSVAAIQMWASIKTPPSGGASVHDCWTIGAYSDAGAWTKYESIRDAALDSKAAFVDEIEAQLGSAARTWFLGLFSAAQDAISAAAVHAAGLGLDP